jgi:hypothetical protein
MVSFLATLIIENALFKNSVVPLIHSFEGALPCCQPLYIHVGFDMLTSFVSNTNILDITIKKIALFWMKEQTFQYS